MPEILLVPSSRPDHPPYKMVRGPSGAWQHDDSTCEAFANGKPCRHTEAAKEATMATDTERIPDDRSLAPTGPLDMVQNVDLDQIVHDLLPDPGLRANGTHPWVYSFKQKGQMIVGLSTDGVTDGVRALAFKGETIRVLWVRVDETMLKIDPDNVYFLACAARYAISPNGQEICLDTDVKSKHVPRFMTLQDGRTIPDDNWYEKGVTKASRNVMESMLPEALKAEMIRRATFHGQRQDRPAISPGRDSEPLAPPRDPNSGANQEPPARTLRELHARGLLGDDFKAKLRELGVASVRDLPPGMADLEPQEVLRRLSGGA